MATATATAGETGGKRKQRGEGVYVRLRELLTADPAMGNDALLDSLAREGVIADTDAGRQAARRAISKTRERVKKRAARTAPAVADGSPAGDPRASQPLPAPNGRPKGRPPGRATVQPAASIRAGRPDAGRTPARPSAAAAAERVTVETAAGLADPDREAAADPFDDLIQVKQVLDRSVALPPDERVEAVLGLADRVGGTDRVRLCLRTLAQLTPPAGRGEESPRPAAEVV